MVECSIMGNLLNDREQRKKFGASGLIYCHSIKYIALVFFNQFIFLKTLINIYKFEHIKYIRLEINILQNMKNLQIYIKIKLTC